MQILSFVAKYVEKYNLFSFCFSLFTSGKQWEIKNYFPQNGRRNKKKY